MAKGQISGSLGNLKTICHIASPLLWSEVYAIASRMGRPHLLFAGVGTCNVLHLLIASVLPPVQAPPPKETGPELEMDAIFSADVAEQVVIGTPEKAQLEPEVGAEAHVELPAQDAVPADVATNVITKATDEAQPRQQPQLETKPPPV